MIIGQGVDIVEIARVSSAIERGGEAFLHRVYTPAEIVEAGNRKNASMAYYAGRWAAKEALSKALGCGIGKNCSLADIETITLPSGAPQMQLSGKAFEYYTELGGKNLFVSISHEQSYAVASVIIEK